MEIITVKIGDNTLDLKETKDLFARLMAFSRSSRDVVGFEPTRGRPPDLMLTTLSTTALLQMFLQSKGLSLY
ncbi:hypothetical protein E2C01_022554 [Portunus trituberculatus]|uniref:Uncharacterized protein n=1 Tax=Portunus trituberculatus TaxID=210409 RepID=A0A5B7E7Y6_PORTR|nr:hypothetical protein [Portunus trituberculatus]